MIAAPLISLPNGNVLIAGEPSTEVYDPITDSFSLAGTMATRPFGAVPWYIGGRAGTLLPNGNVLLTGGEHEDLGYFAQAELYDPSLGAFTLVGDMTRPREGHTSTLLRDGSVLLAGSQLGPGVTASAELYNSDAGTFVTVADMTTPRFWHTATLLMDGRILLTGGFTSYPASTNSISAELYAPSNLIPASVVANVQFSPTSVAVGSSYSANVTGSNLTPQTFFDVRFSAPGSNLTDIVLNWQRGVVASHSVQAGTPTGTWTINGVRPHAIETDHTGDFFPVKATIDVGK